MKNTILLTDQLKTATQKSHLTIEQAYWMKQLMHPNLTREQFVIILKKWLMIFSSFEIELEKYYSEIQNILPDCKTRLKTNLIKKDLAALNESIDLHQQAFFEFNNMQELFGAFYVLEGSSLGNRFILNQMQKHSWYTDKFANFFIGYAGETGNKWLTFKKELNHYAAENNVSEKIIEQANKSFEKLYNYFNQV